MLYSIRDRWNKMENHHKQTALLVGSFVVSRLPIVGPVFSIGMRFLSAQRYVSS